MSKVKLLDLFDKKPSTKNNFISGIEDEIELCLSSGNYYRRVFLGELRSTDEVCDKTNGMAWNELRFCIDSNLLNGNNLSGKEFSLLVADLYKKKKIPSLIFRRKVKLFHLNDKFRVLIVYEKVRQTDYIYWDGKIDEISNWPPFKTNSLQNKFISSSILLRQNVLLRRIKVI